MDDETETLRGNLHALEFLLAQLFVNQVAKYDDPQGWLSVNVKHSGEVFEHRKAEGLSDAAAEAARATALRVMQTAARSLEVAGAGPSQV